MYLQALVWDPVLIEQISLIAEYSLLKEYEVGPMFPLRPTRLPKSNVQHVIFIVRPILSLMDSVATNIKKEEEGGKISRKEYHIFFVPWKSFLCTQKLEVINCNNCRKTKMKAFGRKNIFIRLLHKRKNTQYAY